MDKHLLDHPSDSEHVRQQCQDGYNSSIVDQSSTAAQSDIDQTSLTTSDVVQHLGYTGQCSDSEHMQLNCNQFAHDNEYQLNQTLAAYYPDYHRERYGTTSLLFSSTAVDMTNRSLANSHEPSSELEKGLKDQDTNKVNKRLKETISSIELSSSISRHSEKLKEYDKSVDMTLKGQEFISDHSKQNADVESSLQTVQFHSSSNLKATEDECQDSTLQLSKISTSLNSNYVPTQTLNVQHNEHIGVHHSEACSQNVHNETQFSCGGCLLKFQTVCNLHIHLKLHHGSDGSYYFNHSTLTAYPRFQSLSSYAQTESEDIAKNKLQEKKNRKRKLGHVSHNADNKKLSAAEASINDNRASCEEVIQHDLEKTKSNLGSNVDLSAAEDIKNTTAMDDKRAELQCYGQSTDENEMSPTVPQTKNKKLKRKKKLKKGMIGPPKQKIKPFTVQGAKSNKDTSNKAMLIDNSSSIVLIKKESCVDHETVTHISAEKKKQTVNMNKRKHRKRKLIKEEFQEVNKKADNECRMCDKTFENRSNLGVHIRLQHSDVPYICSICGADFINDDKLDEHRKAAHKLAIHQCELCGKVLSSKGILEGHYLVHKGIKPFACDICVPKREFTRKSQLKSHMETHSVEKNLQCEYCGKPFNARYLMLNHVKYCSGDKPHKCQYCEMSFVTNHCLQKHLRTHTGDKPFVCEVCAFASGNASCLARHMRIHTGEKPYVCKYCQQAFAAPDALKKHVRVHTQEKPYQCSFCVKAFTQSWNLKTHERQHTGETPYKCGMCGVGYKQNVLLKAHLKTHYPSAECAGSILNAGSQSEALVENQSTSVSTTVSNLVMSQQPIISTQSKLVIAQPSSSLTSLFHPSILSYNMGYK